MFRHRSTRALASLGVILSLALTVMAGPATILARQPTADNTATAVPGAVTPGANVAFDVHFKNTSSSNLAQLFLDAVTPDGATLVGVESSNRAGCDASSGDLHCTFGALNAGAEINLRVVYTTPDSPGTFTVVFNFSTTGVAPDKGKNSHGDDYPTPGTVILDDRSDFAGAYTSVAGQIVSDSQALHANRNPQFTQVTAPAGAIGVTVGEATFPCPAFVGSCFGQWSVISVNDGEPYEAGFSVLIGYKGNIGNANFVHLFDDYDALTNPGAYELILNPEDTCSDSSPESTELPCMILSSSGGNSYATLWFTQNGRTSGY